MKFLSKTADSEILKRGLVYSKNRADQNKEIRDLLLAEQMNFCAYTEKYISSLDSVEVEHFNSQKKYNDDYYNYYAVIRKANIYKKDEKYRDAPFFNSLFFQTNFEARIQFITEDLIYEEIDAEDTEARDFIDFLGLNERDLCDDRKKHINRISDIFNYIPDKNIYFTKHKEELNFITAIESKFSIDLSEFYR